MAQPSVAQYFSTRKRAAVDDQLITKARKVLVVDKKINSNELCDSNKVAIVLQRPTIDDKINIIRKNLFQKAAPNVTKISSSAPKPKLTPNLTNQSTIDQFMSSKETLTINNNELPAQEEIKKESLVSTNSNVIQKEPEKSSELDFSSIKQKLTRSAKLAELKASLSRFKHAETRLKEAETKTQVKLQSFKSLELEVHLSPQKIQSPEKSYLSPKKDASVRKQLFSPKKEVSTVLFKSPTKDLSPKTSLVLPYKYRYLAEIFRSIDTVCQMLYNRKETITFRKLKPAVEGMLKRNLYEKHFAQIKSIYPEAFDFNVEKMKVFGMGAHKEQWELVVKPQIDDDSMTSDTLLQRRRHLYNALIQKLKIYHHEFLESLNPPINIPIDKITRWHPEFDIEKVPDVELAQLPQPPTEEKIVTGRDVLERAKQLLGPNKRLETALENFKSTEESIKPETPATLNPVLKGIPKALLEKVRQKQAAKALESMTRTTVKEKEAQMYSRLPEIIRLARNLFVTEKKSVLPVDTAIDKLNNSYRTSLTKKEMEEHLKVISREFPDWLAFHNIRNVAYIKLSKNADVNSILNKLDIKIKEKSAL